MTTTHPPAPASRSTTPPSRGRPATAATVVIGALAVVVAVIVTTFLVLTRGPAGDGRAAQARPATAIDGDQARGATTPIAVEQVPAPEPALVEEPAATVVPVEAGRIDFTGVTCDMIGDEAVYISRATPDLPIRLVDVRDTYPIEDLRPGYPLPAEGAESLVMSCGGTGDWDDGSSSAVYLELTVDSEEMQYVYYLRE